MAVKVISGVLGAGKTYFAVHELLTKHFTFDNNIFEWVRKSDIEIITNIDGLRLRGVKSLNLELARSIGADAITADNKALAIKSYFRLDYLYPSSQPITPRIYIIDEAQYYFDRKFYDLEVFRFFDLSRHYGLDIYLITQDTAKMCREVTNISEYEIESVRRSLQLGPVLQYRYTIGGDVIQRKQLKKDKRVFMAYSSRQAVETSRISSYPLKMAGFIAICVLVVVVGFSAFRASFFNRSDKPSRSAVSVAEGRSASGDPKASGHTTTGAPVYVAGSGSASGAATVPSGVVQQVEKTTEKEKTASGDLRDDKNKNQSDIEPFGGVWRWDNPKTELRAYRETGRITLVDQSGEVTREIYIYNRNDYGHNQYNSPVAVAPGGRIHLQGG